MEDVQDKMEEVVQKALSSSIILCGLLVIGWAIRVVLETAGVRDPIQLPIVGPLLGILTFGFTIISTLQDMPDFLALTGSLLAFFLVAVYYQENQEKEVWER